ncbi:hypothetical protein YIM_43575 [Amycolatopsis sp. YIM 10]|nr:hypothetical protein YIM_43575 [Amycolatopsis sp. YIM 10]
MPVGVTVPASSASPAPLARLAALPGVSTASGVAAAARHAQVTGKVLPVLPELAGLLPAGGLRRGGTVAVHGSPSLLLALLAEATSRGSWAAVVGVPELGVVAAHELGVAVDRLALVNRPGMEFGAVTAALLDGMDLVAVGGAGGGARGAGPSRSQQLARRLSARARNRGAVLLSLGPWPGAEVELTCEAVAWQGLMESGKGFLKGAELTVRTGGRGAAARPGRANVLLPPGQHDTASTTAAAHAAPSQLPTRNAPAWRSTDAASDPAASGRRPVRDASALSSGGTPEHAGPGQRLVGDAPEPAAAEQRLVRDASALSPGGTPEHVAPGQLLLREASAHFPAGEPEPAAPGQRLAGDAPGWRSADAAPEPAASGWRPVRDVSALSPGGTPEHTAPGQRPVRDAEGRLSADAAREPAAARQRSVRDASSRRSAGEASESAAPRQWPEHAAPGWHSADAAPKQWPEPAAPKQWPEPAAPEHWSEPAAPERWVEPAASERWVEPAASERWVEPAAPVEAGVG